MTARDQRLSLGADVHFVLRRGRVMLARYDGSGAR
jgi:hypothetical protein